MKAAAAIVGWLGASALLAVLVVQGCQTTAAQCAKSCGRAGMRRFELVHNTLDADTPICECNPPARAEGDGGSP